MPEEGADSFRLRELVFDVADASGPDDTLLCYFSGHGFLSKSRLFLLLDNTRTDRLLRTALPIADIIEALRHSRAENKLLILDCCHAGAVVSNAGLRSAVGVPVEEAVKPENFMVLMASDHLERARELDMLQGGFLTTEICAALSQDFYDAAGGDQRLEIDDLKRWLEKRARAHNEAHEELEVPTPFLFGQHRGQLFLTVGHDEWVPVELPWCDGSVMVVLPIEPTWDGMAYVLAKFPVTNEQYRGLNLSKDREPVGEHFTANAFGIRGWRGPFYPWQEEGFLESDKPVVCVSYDDVRRYLQEINRSCAASGHKHHSFLPKENLWDFAAFGTDNPVRRPSTWLRASPVIHHKSRTPASSSDNGERTNALGLVDMVGNVWEWCSPEHLMVATLGRAHDTFEGDDREMRFSDESEDVDDRYRRQEIRGGSFLDNLERMPVSLDVLSLPHGRATRHSDLGFRIGGMVPVETLPDEVQMRLRMEQSLEPLPDLFVPPTA
jgi:formylglycine-generating enzyme required for sulfatase activity